MARFSDIVAGGYRAKGSGSGGDDSSIFESKMNRVEPRENDEYNPF